MQPIAMEERLKAVVQLLTSNEEQVAFQEFNKDLELKKAAYVYFKKNFTSFWI